MPGRRTKPVDARIGGRILQARKAARVSQKVLALALGISDAQLHKFETGKNRVSAALLLEIAAMLAVPAAGLLEEGAGGAERSAPVDDPRAEALRERADAFNAAHPIGTPILVWLGSERDGQPTPTDVAGPAVVPPGTGEPVLHVTRYGRIRLSRVFLGAGPDRRELFIDGRRIEAEGVELRLDAAAVGTLQAAAAARGVTAGDLARQILGCVCRDGLIDAVLEDDAQTRARRRYGKAA